MIDAGESIMEKFYQNSEQPLSLDNASRISPVLASDDGLVFPTDSTNDHGTALGNYLDTYQIVLQGNYNICWAASIASILRWERPGVNGKITAVDVVNNTSHSSIYKNSDYLGASQDFIRETLDNYLPSEYIVKSSNYARTREQTRTAINNEDPICMILTSNTSGHAVVNCGYLDWSDGSFTIRIMDPNYSSFQMSDYQSYGSHFYYTTPAGTRYRWKGSIYFNY